nr:MAG TPA_asm: hypothetical protein [Caudoviricetes sp.]
MCFSHATALIEEAHISPIRSISDAIASSVVIDDC